MKGSSAKSLIGSIKSIMFFLNLERMKGRWESIILIGMCFFILLY